MAFTTDDPDYDWKELDMETDMAKMQPMGRIMNATATDLSPFMNKGNRILMYHGWADVGVSPIMTVQYYEQGHGDDGREDTVVLPHLHGTGHVSLPRRA